MSRMPPPGIDRRTLLRMAAVAGVAVAIRPLDAFAQAFSGNVGAQPIGGPAWQSAPGVAKQRIEGFAKVSGAKLYAADFRAADMPGWPATTGHALLVKTTDATHVFEGIDLDLLTPEFRPDRVVLAADLAAAKITVPGFYAGDLLVPAGKTPLYLGQPVALLIWDDFARFSVARERHRGAGGLREDGRRDRRRSSRTPTAPFISSASPGRRRTAMTSTPPSMPAGCSRSATSSSSRNGRRRRRPPRSMRRRASTATRSGRRSRAPATTRWSSTAASRPSRSTRSSSSRRARLAWYDAGAAAARVRGRRPEPHLDREQHRVPRRRAMRPATPCTDIVANCAYVGGGFGGRDFSIFPLYAAIAGPVLAGQAGPARQLRTDQFQFGLKRHAFTHPEPDRRRPGERHDHRLRLGPGPRRRRPRQPLRRRGVRRRRRDDRHVRRAEGRRARRSPATAAPSPPARCAASAPSRP